jgi:hypothetical protein
MKGKISNGNHELILNQIKKFCTVMKAEEWITSKVSI